MKKLLTLLFIASGIGSFAQLRKIPSEVTEAFKEKYPSAAHVEWKDKLTLFAATFEDGSEKCEARFNKKGEWLQTENAIEASDLPEDVNEGLKKSKYAEWETTAFYKIALPDDQTQYRVEVKKSDLQKKNLLFSNEGRLLKDKITL
jgi:hypothetical protein